MTTIVGLTTLNETVLMVDSCLNVGNQRQKAPTKLMTYNSPESSLIPPFAIAWTGRLVSMQIVYPKLVGELKKSEPKPFDTMLDFALTVGVTIRRILHTESIDFDQAAFMLALPGGLYCINDTGDVHEPAGGRGSAGSGGDYALGALHALKSYAPLIACEKAIRVAADLDLLTGGPFHWARVSTSSEANAQHIQTGVITS